MVFWKSKQKEQTQKHPSALDIPLGEYDPGTALPKSIFIGDQQTPPLVQVYEARDHLVLLSAFHQYRASSPDTYPARCLSAARAYAYWAQHTFSPQEPLTPEQLPSLDILMAWHAHMLNPKTFDVDVNGVYASLQGLAFPLSLAARAIESETLPSHTDLTADQISQLKVTRWSTEDISEAIQRQSKFVGNMHRTGWLDPSRWLDHGTMELSLGIVLYHAWLDLAHSTSLKYFLVPRLDIDLAWHSHQLHGTGYKADTERLLGQFLNHDDAAAEDKLGNGLKKTGELWKERFGYDYQPPGSD
ncbi:hypothetical protein B9479_001261 [Cryptococcus floricola]|uniref:Uncharacterized protein n=1 Tax=Cryptococcus floricola TaxID=2591691 RepID=A0A5D3B6I5_9TREE|nr:hypothetical protein B9479_001261 [Cryptococcus floricola]